MIHAESSEPGRSYCGKTLTPGWFTSTLADVTCGSCVRTFTPEAKKRSWSNKKARESEGYNNPQFRGTGANKCGLCGIPIRDHPYPPLPYCPFVGMVERSPAT